MSESAPFRLREDSSWRGMAGSGPVCSHLSTYRGALALPVVRSPVAVTYRMLVEATQFRRRARTLKPSKSVLRGPVWPLSGCGAVGEGQLEFFAAPLTGRWGPLPSSHT